MMRGEINIGQGQAAWAKPPRQLPDIDHLLYQHIKWSSVTTSLDHRALPPITLSNSTPQRGNQLSCLCLKSERSNDSAASVSFYVDSSSWHWGRHILIDLIMQRRWLDPEQSRLYIHPRVHDSSCNGFSMSLTQLRLTLFCSHQHLSCEEWEHEMTNI